MPTNSKKKTTQVPQPWYKQVVTRARAKIDAYLNRRPHRSFRRTRRRDYVRPLVLPKVWSFTLEVTRTLWKQRRIFIPLMLIYIVLYAILVGLGSQDTYTQLTSSLQDVGSSIFGGNINAITQSGITLLALATSGINTTPTDAQQIFGVLLGIMAWLTTV